MQDVMKLKAERKSRLNFHPFYKWVKDNHVPVENRLDFAPILTNFAMNFRDVNKWFIRFPKPRNTFEKIINGNTFEDETHSRLFMEDWRKLDLDKKLNWRAGDMFWWLFLADETEPFRKYGVDFAWMTVVDDADPLVRFAHSEAGEACGNVFFDHVSKVAADVEKKTKIQYRYFGTHHLDREPGHVLESEGIFEKEILNPRQREKALMLANKMFDVFFGIHDTFNHYARTFVDKGTYPQRVRNGQRPLPPKAVSSGPQILSEGKLQTDHAHVQRLLEERRARMAAHPFFAWLRDDSELSAKERLLRFIPMWIMDIMGYRDLNKYALRYENPASAHEAALNRWVGDLETHNALFMNDWDALGLDDVVDWSASETLKFCFLDPQMDVHRENMTDFIKLALGHTQPMRRYWLMEALEVTGYVFFANTRVLAGQVEKEENIRLDYLGDRHDVAHPVPTPEPEPQGIFFKGEPMSAEDRDTAVGMVETVFDAVDEQLSLSLDVARSNKFRV